MATAPVDTPQAAEQPANSRARAAPAPRWAGDDAGPHQVVAGTLLVSQAVVAP